MTCGLEHNTNRGRPFSYRLWFALDPLISGLNNLFQIVSRRPSEAESCACASGNVLKFAGWMMVLASTLTEVAEAAVASHGLDLTSLEIET